MNSKAIFTVLLFVFYITLAASLSSLLSVNDTNVISTPALQNSTDEPYHVTLENICFNACKKSDYISDVTKGKNGENITEYDSNDLFWLSRIIYAEAGIEPFEGKLAVGSVVMNRVISEKYPDTVYGVIFDTKFGVQFTPAATGAIYNSPDEDSILAAKMCLGGYSVSDEILFFLNEAIATSTWMQDNCDFVMSIGNHDFYS